MSSNPFFELYVGDRLSSDEFVNIFSPFLVEHAQALFLPGNVVVTGVQGSGKSMLLSLLKPEVRLEYVRANAKFPVAEQNVNFIGAGINLAHSGAYDFGYRQVSADPTETILYFGDFVNYSVFLDLISSVRSFNGVKDKSLSSLNVDLSAEKQRQLLASLREHPVFQGYLEKCASLDEMEERIRHRLNSYRRFLHLNDKELDPELKHTKTDIGVPVAELARALKESAIVNKDVNFFIHIDQYEELSNISSSQATPPDYRRIINRALARRDPAVSYRIGTRGHAWRNHGFIFGADAKLEEERDYKFVDLDQMLRRNENRKTWIFPRFVEDVFARRLRHVGLATKEADGKDLLERLFGKGLASESKARRYGGKAPERAVKVDREWATEVSARLVAMAADDPLKARLAEAWILQLLDRKKAGRSLVQPGELSWDVVSEMNSKLWWKKERVELALVQIAGRCQQRPLWGGADELIELSGGNVLTFLSICHMIWETNNQIGFSQKDRSALNEIEFEVQAIGVFKASEYWLRKIGQETGRSGERVRLVRQIGNIMSRNLLSDRKMSYPGHNGFSIADEDLERYPHVKSLLEEMSDYGSLIILPHTTKEKDRRSRRKMYLNPVLCPQFKIPYKRLKEPEYLNPSTVEQWMVEAGIDVGLQGQRARRAPRKSDGNLPLFDGFGES